MIFGLTVNGRPCARAFFQYKVGCRSTPSINAAKVPTPTFCRSVSFPDIRVLLSNRLMIQWKMWWIVYSVLSVNTSINVYGRSKVSVHWRFVQYGKQERPQVDWRLSSSSCSAHFNSFQQGEEARTTTHCTVQHETCVYSSFCWQRPKLILSVWTQKI